MERRQHGGAGYVGKFNGVEPRKEVAEQKCSRHKAPEIVPAAHVFQFFSLFIIYQYWHEEEGQRDSQPPKSRDHRRRFHQGAQYSRCGGVDLSIGTGLVCYSLVGGYLIVHKGMPTIVGILAAIILGMLIGVLNGVLVAIMDLPAFLATLCTCMITRGLGSIIVGGFGISWPAAAAPGGWFRSIFKIQSGGQNIPIGFLWVILLVVVMTFVLNHTRIGRYTLAIGSNKEATRLSGVNVRFYHIAAYVICGFFAGLASIAYSAIFATVQPGSGAGFELEAIGGAIIGGVSMTGGVGSITGTLFGVFVICLLKTGLPFIGLTANWQQIITGFVLIAAVLVDILKRKAGKE